MKYETTSSRADRTFELRTVSVNFGRAITVRMPMMLNTVTSSITVNAKRVLRMKTPRVAPSTEARLVPVIKWLIDSGLRFANPPLAMQTGSSSQLLA
jgi:hypothetical protein